MNLINPYTGSREFLPGYKKPGFKYASTKSVVVPGGTNNPSTFIIGGAVFQYDKDIECNLTIQGPGGLNSGSLAASTVYYLYATVFSDDVVLIADINPPSIGLNGYSLWTYLGAFVTNSSSAIPQFVFENGNMRINGYIQSVTQANTTPTAKTLLIPVGAKSVYGYAFLSVITAANQQGIVQSTSTNLGTAPLFCNAYSATNETPVWGDIPIIEAQTVYVYASAAAATGGFRVVGWLENPSEFL